jgi:extracellular elastinolytic metalloproteinase
MSHSRSRRRSFLLPIAAVTTAAALGLAGLPPAAAAPDPAPGRPWAGHPASDRKGNFDARSVASSRRAGTLRAVRPDAERARRRLQQHLGSQAVVDLDPVTGTPAMVGRLDGFLTGASSASAESVTRRFLTTNASTLGLSAADLETLKLRRHYVDVAGIHHLSWTQSTRGIPVFGNGLKANVTKRGQLISLQGSPVAGLDRQAAATGLTAALSAAAAREAAAADVGGKVANARLVSTGRATTWANHDQAKLVWFAGPSGLRLAWSTYVQAGASLTYQHVLDAATGRVLYRHDAVANDRGDALVYDNYPGAPRGGRQKTYNLIRNGLLPASATRLDGNYTIAWSDLNDDNEINGGESVRVPGAATGSAQYRLAPFQQASRLCSARFVCTWNPHQGGSWSVNRRADVTQGFYFTGIYHNYLRRKPFGFTPASGNFEASGADPILLNALDGANTGPGGLPDGNHIDNANMSTPPDGIPPTMQMYLFHFPGASDQEEPLLPTSSSFDSSIILHEYTHGLSNRLVVDAEGNSTLNSLQAGAMGEAWSDYYAEDYLVAKKLERDTKASGEIRSGKYVSRDTALGRTMPIDCAVGTGASRCTDLNGQTGGYTYGDLSTVSPDLGAEVHASGEIWGQTLWDLRRSLGHTVTGMLVTRAMELSPADPSYLDMRNTILQADLAVYGGRHRSKIWSTFAKRGMGFFAGTRSSGDTHPAEDFAQPPSAASPRGTVSGRVTDPLTGAPVAGADVTITGHDSGFPGDYADTADAAGRYLISNVFLGTYPLVTAAASGHLPSTRAVTVERGATAADFALRRDWAAGSGGAAVTDVNGPDLSDFGCGPAQAIDTNLATGWLSTTGDDEGTPTNQMVPKFLVVRLPEPIRLTSFGVDPNATCGLDGSASTADYRIETSPDGSAWTTAREGTFAAGDRGRLNELSVTPVSSVRYVRFTMRSPQVPHFATNCPQGPFGGCQLTALSELAVFGSSQQVAAVGAVGRR